MKRILLAPVVALVFVLLVGCVSNEDKRDAFMENAKKLEQSGDCAKAGEEARNALKVDPKYAGAYLLLGRCDMKGEKWADAQKNFASAHELEPTNFEALSHLARLALLTDDGAKAEEYAAKALALQPNSIEMKIIQGNMFMRKKDFLQAKRVLEEAVKMDPANEEAVVGLASAYLNANEPDNAKALLKYSLEKKPNSAAMLSLLLNLSFREQDYASSEGYLNRLMALHPEDEHLVVQMADLFPLLNKGKEAPAYLAAYLEKHPKADTVRLRLAELHVSDRNFDKALAELDKAPEATPTLRLAKANVLIRSGRMEEGLAALRALSQDPKAGEHSNTALRSLAEIAMQQNKPEDALKDLTALIARSPSDADAYATRGQVYFDLKRFAEAIADFSFVAKASPDDPSVFLALADAQNSSGNHAQAESTIRDVIKRFPEYAPARIALANYFITNTDPYKALEAIREGKKSLPDNPDLAIAEVDILIREERYTEALDLLDGLVKKDNLKGAALLRLAGVHAANKDYAKAIKAYDQLLALDANAMPAVEGRIRMHLAAGEPDKALAFAEKRQKDRPKDPMAAYLVGETALVNKNAQKAEKAFLQALEMAPQWDQPATRLAQIYVATKRIDEGIATLKSLLAKTPDAVAPAVLMANLQEEKGDWKGAEQSYRNLLIKQPKNVLAANNLAYLISRHNPTPERLKEAEPYAAVAAATGNPTTLDTLGWIQHLQGKTAEAESNLRKAHEGNKDNPVVAYHLAAVLASQAEPAKKQEAKTLLKEITSGKTTFPQLPEAEKLLKGL